MGKILEPYFIGAANADYLPGPVPGAEAHDTAELGIKIAQEKHLAFVIQELERKAMDLSFLLHQLLAGGLKLPDFIFDVIVFIEKIKGKNCQCYNRKKRG